MFPKIKFWGSSTIGTKGQVVIPAGARKDLGIKVNDKFIVMGNSTKKCVIFVKAEMVEDRLHDIQTGLLEIQKLTKNKGYKTLWV